MSEINSALGLSQLKKIKTFIKKREKTYKLYKKLLNKNDKISFPKYSTKSKPAYHLMIILGKFKNQNAKNIFMRNIYKDKIEIHYHYKPIYKFKIYPRKNFYLKGCQQYYNKALSLPLHIKINNKDVNYIVNKIKNKIN